MEGDRRSFRVALVSDEYVNPTSRGQTEGEHARGLDGLGVLAAAGWGVMALPATDYPEAVGAALLAEIAEQAEEFDRHGYDLVLVGRPGGALVRALSAVGLSVPDCLAPESGKELRDFLYSRPSPRALADRPR